MKYLSALLAFVASLSFGQQWPIGVAPQTGQVTRCIAQMHTPAQVDSCIFVWSTIEPNNVDPFHWPLFLVLDNFANNGESSAFYVKARKWGNGATWGGVIETQCIDPSNAGSCWVLEGDLMAPPGGDPTGYGVGIFVGRANAETPVRDPNDHRMGHALAGFFVDENAADAGHVDIAVAYDSQIHCTVGCFRMRGGESIAFELSGVIVQKFDPQTGYAGWWRTDLGICVWCVNMSNGQVRQMWHP